VLGPLFRYAYIRRKHHQTYFVNNVQRKEEYFVLLSGTVINVPAAQRRTKR
jgi:hypothetical protein